jgi:capsular polysaccharide biosynthesis protein
LNLTLAGGLRALRERWWILVLAAALGAAATFAYTKLPGVDPRWRSSVSLQAAGRFDYGNSLALEKQLRPLAEQVRQLSVMRDVDRNLHLDLPAERMLEQVKAEPVQDSSQIRIDVEDADGSRAQLIALEIADVFSQQHNASQEAKLREERVMLTVLDRSPAAQLVWPQTRLLVPAAASLGLLAAAGVVLGMALLDDTLKSESDIRRQLDLGVLARVPRTKRRATPGSARAADSASLTTGQAASAAGTRG